jgi:hypothetical protein
MAIEHAYRILGWQENLVKDEMPPPWMWPHEEELEKWFDEVEASRKDKWGGSDAEDGGPMMGNELAKGKR